jgi:predicted nucleotidyltransferase
MRTPNPANLYMVRHVADRLGELRDGVVFLGGAVVDLLITDPAAPPVRATKDVDVIVQVASQGDYYKLGDSLRSLGFREDFESEGGPVCRWVIDDIKVDTMPTQGRVLGFSNDFYVAAVETAVRRKIDEEHNIRLISAPCFLATKIDAFIDRGRGDFMESSDMEDVIAVLDGRPEIIDEIRDSPAEVKNFLVRAFRALLADEGFVESLPGHVEVDGESIGRLSVLFERMDTIASMELEGPDLSL